MTSLRSVALTGLGSLGLAIAACSASAPESSPLPADAQRIVYVGTDYAIFTARSDGSDRDRVTGPSSVVTVALRSGALQQQSAATRYYWPTWSPAGDQLLVSRTPGITEGRSTALVLLPENGPTEQVVHEPPRGTFTLVAQNTPHYARWSPDGQRVSFITSNPQRPGLVLLEAEFGGADGLRRLAMDTPLYHTWAPDSSYMLIHQRERLVRYTPGTGELQDLQRPSLRYRVPAVNRDGSKLAYVTPTDDGPYLVVRNDGADDEQRLWNVDRSIAFLWSPAEDLLAAAQIERSGSLYSNGLDIIDPATGERRRVLEGQVAAFFWSPDGSRIAVVVTDDERRALRWMVVDVPSGESRPVASFNPNQDYLTLILFFDQYAASHSPWSADSTHLVFSGRLAGPEGRGPSLVYVVDVTSGEPPVLVDEGRLAFWVPPGPP